MKKILLATSILAASAGFAAAEVTLSGNARMGISTAYDPVTGYSDDLSFNSRARVAFSMSGTTDGGLEFGASLRADNAAAAASGTAGSVYISGAFGKLSMGDNDGAALATVGHVAGVGYTGLGDLNESTFVGTGTAENALYEYSAGAVSFAASVGQIDVATTPWALGAKYSTDAFSVALGYEDNDAGTDHVILGVRSTLGGVALAANYGKASGVVDGDQWAVSASYTSGAMGLTAFVADDSELGGKEAYGLGASYDLGGGATLAAGYAKDKTTDTDGMEIGVNFSF